MVQIQTSNFQNISNLNYIPKFQEKTGGIGIKISQSHWLPGKGQREPFREFGGNVRLPEQSKRQIHRVFDLFFAKLAT